MTLEATEAARLAMDGMPGEILIVDNDSQDGSFETMRDYVSAKGWGRTRVIQSGRNGGYGAGNNVGIRTGLSDGTRPDFIYILNSDAFPTPDAIKVLYQYLIDHPETGFAGSYIQGEDGVRHTSTFRFPSLASEFENAIRFGPVTAGHEIVFVRESVVTHLGSVSTGMKTWDRVPDYWFDSRFYYLRKNHGFLYALSATGLHLIGGGLHWLRCKLTGKERGISRHFLRTLLRHDLATIFSFGRAGGSVQTRQATGQATSRTGE